MCVYTLYLFTNMYLYTYTHSLIKFVGKAVGERGAKWGIQWGHD